MASALGTRDTVNAARSLPGGAPAPRAHVAAKQEALSERNSKPLGMMFKIFHNPAQPAFPHLSFSRLLQITLIGPRHPPGPGMFRLQSSGPLVFLQEDSFSPDSMLSCQPHP